MLNTTLRKNLFKLPNGVTLILEPIIHFNTVSVSFFIDFGSRDENENQYGFSHFTEHMIFKNTADYNCREIAMQFDEMGGLINAYTSNDLIEIHNTVPDEYLEKNIKLMHDIFQNSSMLEKDIELEKNVILNEMQGVLEDPEEKIYEEFLSNFYPESGLGKPILGTRKSILNTTQDTLKNFYENIFISNNLTISISGKFDPVKIHDMINNMQFRNGISIPKEKESPPHRLFSKNLKLYSEQYHLIAGTAFNNLDPKKTIILDMINILIGESMSSRLFLKIREELSLCYNIGSFVDRSRNDTIFAFYFSTDFNKRNETITEIANVLKKLKQNGIDNIELKRIKLQRIGSLKISSDNLSKRCSTNFFNLQYFNSIDNNFVIDLINSITLAEINEMLITVIDGSRFSTQTLFKKDIKENIKWDF